MSTFPQAEPQAAAPPTPARKRRRIFMWTFLAVQVLFLAWLIAGIATAAHGIPAYCRHGSNSAYIGVKGCEQASQAGTAIGVALVIGLWVAADVILGIGRLVVVFARRSR